MTLQRLHKNNVINNVFFEALKEGIGNFFRFELSIFFNLRDNKEVEDAFQKRLLLGWNEKSCQLSVENFFVTLLNFRNWIRNLVRGMKSIHPSI